MKRKFANIHLEMIDGIISSPNRFDDEKLQTVLIYLRDNLRARLIDMLNLYELEQSEKSNSVTIEIDKVKITINR